MNPCMTYSGGIDWSGKNRNLEVSQTYREQDENIAPGELFSVPGNARDSNLIIDDYFCS